jgi:hypothetical protein
MMPQNIREGLVEWLKHLPSKREAPSSKPQYWQKKKKKKSEEHTVGGSIYI